MEERRDILVAAIDAHDRAIVALLAHDPSESGSQVRIPTPGDRSCGRTTQEAERNVHKRVRWLNEQIDISIKYIRELCTRDVDNWVKHDKVAEQRRVQTYEEQDRRQREYLRNSNIGVAASKLGRDLCDIDPFWRGGDSRTGKRQQII